MPANKRGKTTLIHTYILKWFGFKRQLYFGIKGTQKKIEFKFTFLKVWFKPTALFWDKGYKNKGQGKVYCLRSPFT